MNAVLEREIKKDVKRLEVWMVDLGGKRGSVQSGLRPMLIVQNNMGNKYAPTVIGIPMTTSKTKKNIPTHVNLSAGECGLDYDSTILAEQIVTVDKNYLQFKATNIPEAYAPQIEKAIAVSLGMNF
ncbi:mRNA interferase MazF [compost metagenome]